MTYAMSTRPQRDDRTGAQLLFTLLALLPKDGTRVTVAALATAAVTTSSVVTDTLFDTWFKGLIGFDMPTDTYFAHKTGDTL